MKYKTIDLCAGIGGIRRGFEITGGFENVLSAEIDPWAALTYKNLFGDDPTNDLTSEEFKSIVDQTDYDILLAGFPCQAFSRVGKQMGFRDKTRGTIFFDIADIISRTHPKAIFLENVENLVSHNNHETMRTIIDTLEDELDYRIIGVHIDEDGNYQYSRSSFVRNSKDFGIPQNRPRVYIMGFSKKIYGDAARRIQKELPLSNEKELYSDINEVLEKKVDIHYYMASGYLETLKRHKKRQQKNGNGFGYSIVNDPSKKGKMIANTILATGGSGKERNLVYQPRKGVAGVKLKTRRTKLNDEGIRMMTPTEWGRLQGFIGYAFINSEGIDTFSFPNEITEAQKYKQFGNSVTIPVIETMADFMLECFEDMTRDGEAIIAEYLKNAERITKRDVMDLLRVPPHRAGYLLKKMVENDTLAIEHRGKSTKYRLKD